MKKLILILFLMINVIGAEYFVKEDTDEWFPVILLDDTDFKTAETGKAFGDTTVEYCTQGATSWSTYTDDTNNFKEAGDGCYWLQMGASEFSENNRYFVRVEVSGCLDYRFIVNAIDNTVNETIINVNDIETDTNDIQTNQDWNPWDAGTRTLTAGTKDTEIDAIKGKTDDLTFTTANKVDVRVDYVGSNAVTTPNDFKATGFSTHSASDIWSVATRDLTEGVTVTTNNDKTGYSISGSKTTLDALNDIADSDVWDYATRTITELDEDNTTIDLDSTTVSASASISTEDKNSIVDLVWDEATSGHTTAGTTGKAITDAQSAGNPWESDISTGYTGQAGAYLRNIYDATDGDKESGSYTGIESTIRSNR